MKYILGLMLLSLIGCSDRTIKIGMKVTNGYCSGVVAEIFNYSFSTEAKLVDVQCHTNTRVVGFNFIVEDIRNLRPVD